MDKIKHPFTFKNGFKVATGAYLGWHVMSALDAILGKRLESRFGSVDSLIAKVNTWAERNQS